MTVAETRPNLLRATRSEVEPRPNADTGKKGWQDGQHFRSLR